MSRTRLLSAVLVLVVFGAASAAASLYAEQLHGLAMMHGARGVVLYIVVTIVATVCAPLAALPLIPIAGTMWGPFAAAVFSIIGWIVGALISFYIARRFGRVVVESMVSLDGVDRVVDRILGKRQLVGIILLRMVVPVDVLSYALGLVGTVRVRDYIIGTCIGVVPFGFVFAYIGQTSILTMISGMVLLGAVLMLVYRLLFQLQK